MVLRRVLRRGLRSGLLQLVAVQGEGVLALVEREHGRHLGVVAVLVLRRVVVVHLVILTHSGSSSAMDAPGCAVALDRVALTEPPVAVTGTALAGPSVTREMEVAGPRRSRDGDWAGTVRSEEHTSELQSLMRIPYD